MAFYQQGPTLFISTLTHAVYLDHIFRFVQETDFLDNTILVAVSFIWIIAPDGFFIQEYFFLLVQRGIVIPQVILSDFLKRKGSYLMCRYKKCTFGRPRLAFRDALAFVGK